MKEFCVLILVLFFVTNSLDTAESVQLEELEELPLQTFDELFVDEWWDKDEAEELKTPAPTNFGQNVYHQIDRQNTQTGQIEPKNDQNPPLVESDHSGQIEPKNDHNPPLTESDQSDRAKNGEEQSENIAEDERKRKIVAKFHEMKDEFKQKGKYSAKEWVQIEEKIAKHLKVNRKKIYKWKKEFGLSSKKTYNERKILVEKFNQMKAELNRAGFKNSYKHEIDKIVAKEFGRTDRTICNWKRELGQTTLQNKYPNNDQKKLMKRYYEIKDENLKISDEKIAKRLKICRETLYKWKKQFKRQEFHPNSVDGHSVEENAAANIQEIEHSN